jgi:hypothetical protein
VVGSGGRVVVGSGGRVVVGSGGRVVVGSGGRVVVEGGAVLIGMGVVAAGRTGACTFPVELLLPHALARTTSNPSTPTVVVFMQRLLLPLTS